MHPRFEYSMDELYSYREDVSIQNYNSYLEGKRMLYRGLYELYMIILI